MKGILSTLAILIVIGWAIGYFRYHVEGFFFHLTLVVALVSLFLQFLPTKITGK
ncbi:lmo0937 family membrane protein [Fluviicola taffensis]|uniref:Lmo0937 family membrane protein n=1 Tax=Fluviicola taffensis (strain DSM 16823 / NCIMB 13979 / RW262) TaxID=755732 RepID=F2IJZ5_FLUTR|nr:lmo0937 family membrane protein [Fluviicola taffensis]AEA45054.1 hypothetical protein Fluta_3078 [Fluviicola taffensis DSM 16823]